MKTDKPRIPDASHVSAAVRAANPHLYPPACEDGARIVGSQKTGQDSGKRPGKRRRAMNKTEAAFAAILDAKMRRGEIVSYEYEGITLRWGKIDGIRYTPDFTVFERIEAALVRICFVEVKGGHIWPKDMQKFKQARNEWPHFGFEMWQRKSGSWTQIL